MSLVHNIYLDLSNAISVIDNIINIAASKDQEFQSSKPTLIGIDDDFPEKKECMNRIMTDYENSVREGKVLSAFEERTKFFSEVLVTCGLKDSEKQQTLKSSGIYGEITSERNRVYNLRSEIYQDAYRREFSVFLKMTGFSFYSSGVNFTLSDSLNNPKWVPEPDLIYSLQNMQAMQTIDGGILMVSRYPWGDSHIVFLDTTINFVDGKSLDGFYANYIGNHKYQSISGTRNVYSFKLFPYKRNQLVNGTQFYFYPNVILQQ